VTKITKQTKNVFFTSIVLPPIRRSHKI